MRPPAISPSRRSVRTAVIIVAASLAFSAAGTVIATSTATAETVPKSAVAERYAAAMLTLLNRERASHRLRPLTMKARLCLAGYRHNKRQAAHNSLSHQFAGEPFFATRISNAGYRWRAAGENIAWSPEQSLRSVRRLQTAMYRETAPNNGHRLNILSSTFTQVGIDVYIDNTHHKIWITQDFARPW